MNREKHYIGERVGRLTIIADTGRRYFKMTVYLCRCDCGRDVEMTASEFSRRSHCGCVKKPRKKRSPNSVPIIRDKARSNIGIKKGRLTLMAVEKELGKALIAVCQCDCGKIHRCNYKEFIKGRRKSCGCLTVEKHERSVIRKASIVRKLKPIEFTPRKDFTDHKYGRLTVLSFAGVNIDKGGIKHALWLCQCECGGIAVRISSTLGDNSSCGCLARERATETRRKNAPLIGERAKKKRLEKLAQGWENRASYDKKHRRIKETLKTQVLDRFDWTCAFCKFTSNKREDLHAHHIKSHALFVGLRYITSNHILLCRHCHEKLHKHFNYKPIPFKEHIKYIHSHSWMVRELTNKQVKWKQTVLLTG